MLTTYITADLCCLRKLLVYFTFVKIQKFDFLLNQNIKSTLDKYDEIA